MAEHRKNADGHTDLILPRVGYRREIMAIVAVLLFTTIGSFAMGYFAGGGTAAGASQPKGPDEFGVFWEVWDYVESEFYYEMPSVNDLTYGAIRGMLQTLDDNYTAFVQPSIAVVERENVEGVFGGIGAYVQLNEYGQLIIAYPFPGHPAANVGLQTGDVILSIDGQSLENLTLAEGTALIRGPLGSVVQLEVFRPVSGETFTVGVERAEIQVPTVRAEMLEGDIAYVALYRFNGVATLQLENELQRLLAEQPRALIFDLRGNPGGLLDEAVSISDLFLTQGLVATQRTSLFQEPRVFYAETGDIAEDIPLLVLIDGGSASASEIVAGALQDRERAILVGTPTFGKGSVQLVHDLSDGSQLRITYGAWYTPEEQELNGTGIKPDVEVSVPDDLAPGQDPWLDAAIEYINLNLSTIR